MYYFPAKVHLILAEKYAGFYIQIFIAGYVNLTAVIFFYMAVKHYISAGLTFHYFLGNRLR